MNPHDALNDQGFPLLACGQIADKLSWHGKWVKIDNRLAKRSVVKPGIDIIRACLGGGNIEVFIAAGTHQAKAGQRFAAGGKPCVMCRDGPSAVSLCALLPRGRGRGAALRRLAEPVETLPHQHNIATQMIAGASIAAAATSSAAAKRCSKHLLNGGIADTPQVHAPTCRALIRLALISGRCRWPLHNDHLTAIGDALPVDSSRRKAGAVMAGQEVTA